ncbi:MAG: hypothetical protein ACREOH_02210 [Candidatus Entotheonellia bacterium]
MQRSSRTLLVGALALGGIILLVLGIVELRELLVVGQVPPERLGRQVGYTTVSLALALWVIVWCLVAGKAWARGIQAGTTGGETPSSRAR